MFLEVVTVTDGDGGPGTGTGVDAALKNYQETAKGAVVHHGLKALKLTLSSTKECATFALALHQASAPPDKGNDSKDKGKDGTDKDKDGKDKDKGKDSKDKDSKDKSSKDKARFLPLIIENLLLDSIPVTFSSISLN